MTRFLKLILLAAGSIGAAWLSLAVGVAGVTRERAPQVALKWWPGDARALSASATQTLATAGAQGRERAGTLAAQAIRRDPLLPDAVATLAIARFHDTRATSRSMAYSESLSRRNLPTQLWFIEEAVARNDIRQALRHYDIALRVSQQAPNLLFPILGAAIGEAAIVPELARVLAHNPLWRRDFLLYAIQNSPHPSRVADLSRMSMRLGLPFGADLDGLLITRLVDGGDFGRALEIYRRIAPAGRASATVRNGDFEHESDGTSFDWLLVDNAEFWARRAQDGAQNIRLEFGSSSGGGGRVAQQLLVLGPGGYALRFQSGSLEQGERVAPAIVIRCLQNPNQILLRLVMPMPAAGSRRGLSPFTVPSAGCRAQWLQLELRGDEALFDRSGWVDSISIAPASASPAASRPGLRNRG